MSRRPSPSNPPSRRAEGRLWLRLGLILPALATVVALAVAALGRATGEGSPRPEALELLLTGVERPTEPPRYGVVLTDVLSAVDAVETAEGWVVLDRRAQQLVFLDSSGNLVGLAGGRGSGPGELERAGSLALLDSLLVVIEASGALMHVFSHDGTFQRRVALTADGCPVGPVRQALGGSGTIALLRTCSRPDGSTSARVERIDGAGVSEVLEDRVYNDLASGSVDPARFALLARVGNRLYFGVAPERCVTQLLGSSDARETLCHPAPVRVGLPDSIQRTFRDLEPRMRAAGATLIVPDHHPPFNRLLSVGGRLAFHVVLGDRERALDVVVNGGLERIVPPPETILFAGERSLLVAQERLEGTAFAVVALP